MWSVEEHLTDDDDHDSTAFYHCTPIRSPLRAASHAGYEVTYTIASVDGSPVVRDWFVRLYYYEAESRTLESNVVIMEDNA